MTTRKQNLFALFTLVFLLACMSYVGRVEMADCQQYQHCEL